MEKIIRPIKINKSNFKVGNWYSKKRIYMIADINDPQFAAESLIDLMETSYPIIEMERF